jgi:hypothetical protein
MVLRLTPNGRIARMAQSKTILLGTCYTRPAKEVLMVENIAESRYTQSTWAQPGPYTSQRQRLQMTV